MLTEKRQIGTSSNTIWNWVLLSSKPLRHQKVAYRCACKHMDPSSPYFLWRQHISQGDGRNIKTWVKYWSDKTSSPRYREYDLLPLGVCFSPFCIIDNERNKKREITQSHIPHLKGMSYLINRWKNRHKDRHN